MLFPNITAMFKWANNFFPGAPSASQDYLQVTRQSDGTILGWIDENGIRRGSLVIPAGFTFGTITSFGEIVNFSGLVGSVVNAPNGDFFQLYKNGALLNPVNNFSTKIFLNSNGVSWQLVILGTGASATLQIVEVPYNPFYSLSTTIQSPNGSYWALSILGNELITTPTSPPATAVVLLDTSGQLWQVVVDNTGEFIDINPISTPPLPPDVDYTQIGSLITLVIPATAFDTFVSYYTY